MFPFRLSWVFRSRWMALLWAAGICWTAVDFASPEAGTDANQSAEVASDGALDFNKADMAETQAKLRNW